MDYYTGNDGGTTLLDGTYNLSSGFVPFTGTLSSYGTRDLMFVIRVGSQGTTDIYIDDVCPVAWGCENYLGTPTPTVANTATPTVGGYPYGYGTPLPIDWGGFPTQVPFPTFPPFPSQVPFPTFPPYPTPLYGLGTPQPITGSVTISGVVKIDDRTPVAVKIDDRTPVRVSIAPDPNYTPGNPGAWGGSVSSSAPKPGLGIPTLISSPNQSAIQYGQGGSATNPINFMIEQVDWVTPCLNFAVVGAQCITLTVHYLYPSQFNLMGIDLLPGLYGLAAAFYLVFLLRQLQAR